MVNEHIKRVGLVVLALWVGLSFACTPAASVHADEPEKQWHEVEEFYELQGAHRSLPAALSTLYVEEGKFAGELPQVDWTVEAEWVTYFEDVSRFVELKALTEEQIKALPDTRDFELRSDSAPGAIEMLPLTISDIVLLNQYKTDALPVSVSDVIVEYIGTESWLVQEGSYFTVKYEGWLYDTTPAVEPTDEEESEPFDYTPIIVAATATSALGSAFLVAAAYYRRTRLKIVSRENGTMVRVAKVKIKKQAGEKVAYLPVSLRFDVFGQYLAIPPNAMVKKEQTITLFQGERQIYKSVAKSSIKLYALPVDIVRENESGRVMLTHQNHS